MFRDLEQETWRDIIRSLEKLVNIYEIGNNIVSLFTISLCRLLALKNILDDRGLILEIGPGSGHFTKKLLGRSRNVICLEPSPFLANLLLEKFREALDIILGVAERIPMRNESIATIVCTFSFRDFFNKKTFLKEAYRCLEPGGYLIIVDTHGGSGVIKRIFIHYIDLIGRILSKILKSQKNLLSGLNKSILEMHDPLIYLYLGLKAGFRKGFLRKFLFNAAFILILQK